MCQGTFFFIKKERLGQKTSGRKDLFIRLEVIKTSKILFCLGEM
jgi:hypothetical protein